MTATETVRAAVVQMCSSSDVRACLEQAERLVNDAAQAGATLIVLPENFGLMPRYESQRGEVAEAPGQGMQQQFLSDAAARHGVWLLGGSVPIRSPDGRSFAASLLYGPDGLCAGRYDKLHLFDVAFDTDGAGHTERYCESDTIAPGALDTAPPIASIGGLRLGLSVCYDLRFPEHYRRQAQTPAQAWTVPAAFTYTTGEAHWSLLLRARAVENLAFVLGANQCSLHDNGRRTWGHSMIVDPWGRVLAQLDEQPGVAVADLDLRAQADQRARFPVLQHRRI